MTTYITGYDGSDGARAALRFTKRLAETAGAEVIAAAVYQQSPLVFGTVAKDGPSGELEQMARQEAETTLARAGVPEVTHIAVGAPSPAEGLHRIAEDQHASLLAVGATHRGAVGRIFLGSVAEHLLHGAPCPVAVVPATHADAPVQTVAVAYDKRPESIGALAAAETLARRLNARLVILAVHELIVTPYVGAGVVYANAEMDRDLENRLRADVETVAAGIADVETEARVITGQAGPTLVEAAGDADLLVMGSRGYGPARGVLLGSVSRHVVDHAPCPVVVVPRGVESDVLGRRGAVAAEA